MSTVNKAILIGRLGKNAVLNTTNTGKQVCNFSLATTEKWKDANGVQKEAVQWHQCVLWGELGVKMTPLLTVGRLVTVEGSIQTRKYEKDNTVRYSTEIIAEGIQLLDSKPGTTKEVANE